MKHIKGPGDYDLAIVGESNYQRALVRTAGRRSTKDNRRVECEAVLHLETDNPYDRNAVRVTIKGETVGYVSRADAPEVREALGSFGVLDGQQVEVDAIIVGGREGNNYGVWLDLTLDYDEDDDEDLKSNPPPTVPAKKDRTPQPAPVRPAQAPPSTTPTVKREPSKAFYVVSGLLATVVTLFVVGGLVTFLMSLF